MTSRRHVLSMAATMAWMAVPRPTLSAPKPQPEIAFTFDDPKLQHGAHLPWQEVNERILGALAKHGVKSVLFVCGMRIDADSGKELVGAWDRGGHLIANHTYSHLNFNTTGLAEFEADALRAEPLISGYRHFARLFRYPMFKEGDTAAKRDGMRAFLRAHGYRMGRATIDASDWAINTRLEKCLRANPAADVGPYRAFFLQHMWERAQYYQHLAQEVLQQPVRHTVLLHHSTLNALFVSDLIAMFAARGWRPIDAAYAYQDPIYERQPKCLPAGESLVWGLAKETGHFESELRYPGEDDVYENPKMDALGL
jgi:peptidoglycan/xylan/chitin deacetylase (PgdA/CDA1 family)